MNTTGESSVFKENTTSVARNILVLLLRHSPHNENRPPVIIIAHTVIPSHDRSPAAAAAAMDGALSAPLWPPEKGLRAQRWLERL